MPFIGRSSFSVDHPIAHVCLVLKIEEIWQISHSDCVCGMQRANHQRNQAQII
jgi:hypothetical protein